MPCFMPMPERTHMAWHQQEQWEITSWQVPWQAQVYHSCTEAISMKTSSQGPASWQSLLCDVHADQWEITENLHGPCSFAERNHTWVWVWCDSVNMQEIWSCGYGWRAAWMQHDPESGELDHPPCSSVRAMCSLRHQWLPKCGTEEEIPCERRQLWVVTWGESVGAAPVYFCISS